MYILKRFNVLKTTDDEKKKNAYLAKGFELVDRKKTAEDTGVSEEKKLKEMTLPVLKAYAAENNIDLMGETKKARLVEIILAHEVGNDEDKDDEKGKVGDSEENETDEAVNQT